MKITCIYDKDNKEIATSKCDICEKPLCLFCGYSGENWHYCNECFGALKDNERADVAFYARKAEFENENR